MRGPFNWSTMDSYKQFLAHLIIFSINWTWPNNIQEYAYVEEPETEVARYPINLFYCIILK